MRATLRLRLAVLALAVLVTWLLFRSPLSAQNQSVGSQGQTKQSLHEAANPDRLDEILNTDLEVSTQNVMTDHVKLPLTVKSVETWLALQKPTTLALASETPLEEAIARFKKSAKGKDERGVTIHVDPVSLQEAEKTLTSTVILDVEDVPLASVLELLLKQLGLTYFIQQDGVIVVSLRESDDGPYEVLPVLSRIQEERAMLRGAVAALRTGPGRGMAGGMGGMGGGFR